MHERLGLLFIDRFFCRIKFLMDSLQIIVNPMLSIRNKQVNWNIIQPG